MNFNNEEFSEQIEKIVKEKKVEYIDAVIMWCDKHDRDVEYVGEVIKRNIVLRSKIEIEAERLNFIPKISRLPI